MKLSFYSRTPTRRFALSGSLAIALGILTSQAQAAGTASEQANVDVMIRQLNAVEAVARRSAELPSDGSTRYSLDYNRLAADIARIRQGLQDYLAPSRAQPRDAAELSGQYQREGAQP
ncbi:type III effector Hop protein [Pseudomonas oryzihabitans]|nr:type III effector Hop protein [Pseudomonas oryzihabitans]